MKILRIGLDCDDTVNFWYSEYIKIFREPSRPTEIGENMEKYLKYNKQFWTSLPIKHIPVFKALRASSIRTITVR